MKIGIELIADERARQIAVEGWTPEHDDEQRGSMLTHAAIEYLEFFCLQAVPGMKPGEALMRMEEPRETWSWAAQWWKPAADPVRNLVKAGALIAAEIDRIQRARAKQSRETVEQQSPQIDTQKLSPHHGPECGCVRSLILQTPDD